MRRTPLQRKTPLQSRSGLARGSGLTTRRREPVGPPEHGSGIDLAAAAAALSYAATNSAPAEYAGPVETSQRAPKPASTGFSYVTRQTIIDRDHMRCQRCGMPIDTSPVGYSIQHRDNRAMGGTSDPRTNLPSNGLTLCGSGTTGCHGKAEANPEWAERLGYAVASWADPATVPVLTFHGWVLLSPQGTAWPTKAPPNGDAHTVARRKDPYR